MAEAGSGESDDAPIVHVELRPPRAGLDASSGMDAWIDLNHAVRRFTSGRRRVFLTDDAVGQAEEESLGHLAANLDGHTERHRLVPFLTCKHPLEYCLLYAERAASMGLAELTVVGGDTQVGPPRCVDHAFQLRQLIRRRVPSLSLGGWANPFRRIEEQAGFLAEPSFCADYVLTQIVSQHSAKRLEGMLKEARTRGVDLPVLAGIFHYRSANSGTLERLGTFFPVPAVELTAEFAGGDAAEDITARSLRAAIDAGADGAYISNLGLRGAHRRLDRILRLAGL
jgi:5,10-methylenetetrahydrofolate reductase